jgi:hypothetical protein
MKSIVGRHAGNVYPMKRAKFDPRTSHRVNMNSGQQHKQFARHGNITYIAEIADTSCWTSRQNMIVVSMALPFDFRWRKG